MMPSAILFGLENVLTDQRASLLLFGERFVAHYAPYLGQARVEDVQNLIIEVAEDNVRPLPDRWELLQDALPWVQVPPAKALRDYWYQTLGYCAQPARRLYTTLNALHEQHIKLGIIANGVSDIHNQIIETLGIRNFMDVILLSEIVQLKKPDRRIYELALSELKTKAHRTWYIGDHPTVDIIGATQAGLVGVWLRGRYPWSEEIAKPEYIIEQLDDILALAGISH